MNIYTYHYIAEKITPEKATNIFSSKLASAQKIILYNNTIIPAAVYITGNLYPNESKASSLKRCSNIDKEIRKNLIDKNLLGKTSTKTIAYCKSAIKQM